MAIVRDLSGNSPAQNVDPHYQRTTFDLPDGVNVPSTKAGLARMFVDVADGDLKVVFGDGVTKTIVTDV